MTNEISSPRRRALQITSAVALTTLGGMAGCSKSDDAQAAVKEAGRNFTSIAVGDPTAAETFAETTYKETGALLDPYKGDKDGYAEAAAISYSLSKLGQASLASMKASEAETQALQKARVIRGMINEWLTLNAIAQAAGQFDPTAELDEIKKIIAMRTLDIEHYTAERTQIESQISNYESQIADLRSKSSIQRNESGALELQMPRVSAIEAAKIVLRVREYTLRADQYELEAVRIEGVVGQLRPGAREVGLNVEKATSQIALLIEARDELHQRLSSSQDDAKQAREGASTAKDRIDNAVAQYTKFRDNDVLTANESTISLARSAMSALRDARRATKQTAALTKSSAQQTLGECYARQAAGYREAAILYHWLDEAGIPGDWASQEQAARDAQTETETAAKESFQGAASALRSARFRGIEGEKLEATALRLDKLAGIEPEPQYDESYDDGSQDINDTDPASDGSAEETPAADDG